MKPILGIDASLYQGTKGMSFARFGELHEAGVRFGIFRATIGTGSDPSFKTNVARAEKREWLHGGYHYLFPNDGEELQATAFVKAIKGVTEFAVLDVEESGLTRKHVKSFVRKFRELAPQTMPLWLYTSQYKWSSITNNMDIDDLFDGLWNAYWTERGTKGAEDLPSHAPPARYGGIPYTPLWQFGLLRVKGEGIDGDAFYGTIDQLREIMTIRRTPMVERPRYIDAHNDLIGDLTKKVQNMEIPEDHTKPAEIQGFLDAKVAIIDAIKDLRMSTVIDE